MRLSPGCGVTSTVAEYTPGRDASVRVRLHVVVGQAFELVRRDVDRAHVVADVALELLPDAHQLFVERPHTRADRGVLVDPRTAEIAQHAEEIPARSFVLS